MKRETKIFFVIFTFLCSFLVIPSFGESSDYGSIPMCERFSLTGNEGNSSINYRFFFTPDFIFNVTVICDQTSTSNITIEITAEEEQNISVLQPGGLYNFMKDYPWTPIPILYDVNCNITLNDLSKSCTGLIIYGNPLTNCTLIDTKTIGNFSSVALIGSFLIILFTSIVVVLRKNMKRKK